MAERYALNGSDLKIKFRAMLLTSIMPVVIRDSGLSP